MPIPSWYVCPVCNHEWTKHDPEDGKCDSHSSEPDVIGVCRCGRDIEFTQRRNAELSKTYLGRGPNADRAA